MKMIYFLDLEERWRRLPFSSPGPDPFSGEYLRRVAENFHTLFATGAETFILLDGFVLMLRRQEDGTALALGERNMPRAILGAQLNRALKQVATLSIAPGANRLQSSSIDAPPLSSSRSATPTLPDQPSPFLSIEEVGPAEFSLLPEEPGAFSSSPAPSSPPSPSFSWSEARELVASSLELTREFLGPTVAANYWRQALREADLDTLQVDFRGTVRLQDDAVTPDASDQRRLQQALEQWQERCQRVIPDFQTLRSQLRLPRWALMEFKS